MALKWQADGMGIRAIAAVPTDGRTIRAIIDVDNGTYRARCEVAEVEYVTAALRTFRSLIAAKRWAARAVLELEKEETPCS